MKYPLLVFVLIWSGFAGAQVQRNFTSYTVDNGLAQNTVWDAFQDYKGYMWFGTADGVNRFDGYNMYHYKWNSKDSNSLLGSTAFKFYEDTDKNLWIGHNKGVSVYNRSKDCFKNLMFYADARHTSGDPYASVLVEDQKGRVWCMYGSHELIAVSKRTLEIEKKMVVSNSRFPSSSIRTCVQVGKYAVVYLNDSGTTWFRINTETDEVNIIHGPPKPTGYFMKYNDSLLCCFGRDRIYLYHVNRNVFEEKRVDMGSVTNRLNALVATSAAWWQGKIYIGSNTGLFVLNPEKLKYETCIRSFNKSEKTGFYYVQFLRVDHSGNLWICTNGDGAKCLSPYRNKFIHLNTFESRNRLVKSITTDTQGNIYTGLYAEGIITYKANGEMEQYKFGKQKDEHAHVLAQTFWNNRYYVVNDRYLKELDPRTKREKSSVNVFHYKNKGYIAYPYFYQYKNKLYLCCDISIYEIKENGQCRPVFKLAAFDTLLTTFCILNDTNWWLGTTRSVFCYNPTTAQMRKLPVNVYVKTICQSRNKKHIWIAGNAGLYLMNTNGVVLQSFDVTDGLPDDFIYGILEDDKGKYWMSHNKGISVYDPKTKTFAHYGVKDGLQSNEFNTGAYHKDKDGRLYFGGVNGINVINPNQVFKNNNRPQVSINQILLGDIPLQSDTQYNEITSLNLSYLENTLSFDFSALEFSQPEDNTYKYMLQGYDHNWIACGNLHFARYANLPPGNYTFKVIAANGDGVWNDVPKEVFIRIIPPFWQRTWFYALVAGLVIVLIVGAFYLYNKRQQMRLRRELEVQQKLEQERIRISRDLHDNVGAQLSYLITNIDWIIRHPDQLSKEEEQKRLLSLSEAGRNAILTLRQTIWAISSNSLSVDDFADRFKQFALKMLEFDKRMQVTFDESMETNRMLSPSLALNIFRICQEAFNNALKHAECTHIHVSFESKEDVLFSFTITDNGKGFMVKEGEQAGQYGLMNMRARAEECGAVLTISSQPGAGTRLTLLVN